jgi:hypothetical protein
MKLSPRRLTASFTVLCPLHKPLVFRGGIGLRQDVLAHQCLEVYRRPIDGRRLQAEIEVPRDRVVAVHAVLQWQPRGLISRQCRVLRAICCVDVRLINCKKGDEGGRERSGKSFVSHKPPTAVAKLNSR